VITKYRTLPFVQLSRRNWAYLSLLLSLVFVNKSFGAKWVGSAATVKKLFAPNSRRVGGYERRGVSFVVSSIHIPKVNAPRILITKNKYCL
jgi:hypothetical protein